MNPVIRCKRTCNSTSVDDVKLKTWLLLRNQEVFTPILSDTVGIGFIYVGRPQVGDHLQFAYPLLVLLSRSRLGVGHDNWGASIVNT